MYPGLYAGYDTAAKIAYDTIHDRVDRELIAHLITQLENTVGMACMVTNEALHQWIYFEYDPHEGHDIFEYFE